MPGMLRPIASGFSCSSRRISAAGTSPITKYLPILAVWQDSNMHANSHGEISR